jgi:hypothetical protein
MTQEEVQSLLEAKPIESGHVEAGDFRIYGSTQTFNITPDVHYSNILVLFTEGKVTGIYSGALVPGGGLGLQEMREWFIDLPSRHTE